MQTETCHHCGYDLTGLSGRGRCPECGKTYDTGSLYRQRERSDNPLVRHGKTLTLGAFTLMILFCGGVLSIRATDPLGLILGTLFFAALPAFGAFAYWWSERQERRDSD